MGDGAAECAPVRQRATVCNCCRPGQREWQDPWRQLVLQHASLIPTTPHPALQLLTCLMTTSCTHLSLLPLLPCKSMNSKPPCASSADQRRGISGACTAVVRAPRAATTQQLHHPFAHLAETTWSTRPPTFVKWMTLEERAAPTKPWGCQGSCRKRVCGGMGEGVRCVFRRANFERAGKGCRSSAVCCLCMPARPPLLLPRLPPQQQLSHSIPLPARMSSAAHLQRDQAVSAQVNLQRTERLGGGFRSCVRDLELRKPPAGIHR